MAQSYISQFGRIVIPGAYSSTTVATQPAASGVSGILTLVGEADGGAAFSAESNLEDNCTFGPTQLSDVKAKYLYGNLVDAFQAAIAPSADEDVQGAPTKIILIKTNPSTQASSSLLDPASAAYGTLKDKNYGKLGNLLYYTVDETAEVKPTTSSFTYIPNVGTVNASLRANGGTELALALVANTSPSAFQAAVDALAGVAATGGATRSMISAVSGNLTLAVVSGNTITLTRSSNWNTTPTVGDTLVIPSGSVVQGGSNQNIGAYVITAATSNTLTATKLSDAGKGGAVPGTITAPSGVGSIAIAATTDAQAFSPVTITLEGSTIVNGIGKTLEINSVATGTDLLTRQAFVLGTTTPVTWISATGSAKLLTSATEREVTLEVSRQADSISESWTAGGDIYLKLGYTGTTCSVTVSATSLTTTVTGGSGANLNLTLSNFSTLADLASYINAQTGYSCAVGTVALGQKSPTLLDEGTFTAGTTFGNQTLRLKADLVDFYTTVNSSSATVSFTATGVAGLPATLTTATYLSGGTLGATTDANYEAAIDALRYVDTNFIVPLFSRDASADISDGETDSSSSYTLAAIHAYTKTHCLQMSTYKKRKERSAGLSSRSSFADVRDQSANLASFRATLDFADAKELTTRTGGIKQFQPWMTAVKAAAFQAAAASKTIFNKVINTAGGFVYSQSDFNIKNDDNLGTALDSGLSVVVKEDDGSWRFLSDQTTYQKDDNFVYNSRQGVYSSDVINSTVRSGMRKAYIGKTLAQFDAQMALSTLESLLDDLRDVQKYIASSDDAPKGYKNATILISKNAMAVKVEVKEATGLYFISIQFTVSQITQTASQ